MTNIPEKTQYVWYVFDANDKLLETPLTRAKARKLKKANPKSYIRYRALGPLQTPTRA